MKHAENRSAHEKLLYQAAKGDAALKATIETFLFHKLQLRRNAREAIVILSTLATLPQRDVSDCIIWFSRSAHSSYNPTKGKISKYFIVCISNYLESKNRPKNIVAIEENNNDYSESLKVLRELDGGI